MRKRRAISENPTASQSSSEGDFDAVVEEIQAEARRRRESGEYPAAFERELDALFEDLVPERLREHDFEAVLDRAERASLIDLHAPVDDERRAYAQVKRGVQKLILWYMDYVVRQLATFAASTTRAVRLLGNRVEAIDERQTALARRLPEVGDVGDLLPRDHHTVESWSDGAVALLSGVSGRILHAEAGDGGVVKRLLDAGADAYGVDPEAAEDSLELRAQGALEHLGVVGEGALGGLLLSGITDRAPTEAKIRLAQVAGEVLAPGGRVVLLGNDPEHWAERVPAALADLAPGRPFHADTWRLLLERSGFDGVDVRTGPETGTYLVTATRG
ncbi:MAG: hypothetical protein HYU28_08550 [Actinobacteria bacterium]|nr:hypothetical protein [Actinomycetota bacterium]